MGMIMTTRENSSRRGMTLIEVMISMALFSIMICAFLQLQFSTLQADRISTLQMSGTVALRGQMEQSVASAYDNMENKASIAQGLLSYFAEMSRKNGLGDVANVRLEGGAIVYTFPVPVPGGSLAEGAGNLFENAVGTFTVYLRENSVPADFVTWKTFHDDGSVSPGAGGFDMNGDRTIGDDFSGLFTAGEAAIEGSDVNCLPVQGEIRYYGSAADKARDLLAYSVVRNFIINGESSVDEEIGRDYSRPRYGPGVPE